jgi:hypothetical protein
MHARAALPYAHAGGHCSASACTALNSLGARATPRGPSLAMPEKFTSWPKNLFLHQFFTHRSCIPGKTGGTLQSFRGHRRANKHGPARRAAELALSIDTADAELSLRRRRVNETARRRVRSVGFSPRCLPPGGYSTRVEWGRTFIENPRPNPRTTRDLH